MSIFKILKDYTQYEISDSGVIRKIVTKKNVKLRKHPREGLMMCDLYDNNLIARTVYPHKEVAKTFIPTKKKGRLLVIHINGKKADNKVKNLQWITVRDFQKLQVELGTRKRLGNPELYKYSKFWQAKHKKTVKEKKQVRTNEKPAIPVKPGVTKGKKLIAVAFKTNKNITPKSKTTLKKNIISDKVLNAQKANYPMVKIKKLKTTSIKNKNIVAVKSTINTKKPVLVKPVLKVNKTAKPLLKETSKVEVKKEKNLSVKSKKIVINKKRKEEVISKPTHVLTQKTRKSVAAKTVGKLSKNKKASAIAKKTLKLVAASVAKNKVKLSAKKKPKQVVTSKTKPIAKQEFSAVDKIVTKKRPLVINLQAEKQKPKSIASNYPLLSSMDKPRRKRIKAKKIFSVKN
jgi:hypothetical protein